MRSLATAIFFLTSLTSLAQSTRWTNFEKAWDNYLSKPTHDNSVKAYVLLPDKIMGGDYPSEETTDRIYSRLDHLKERVQQGDRDAVRLAFKLFTIADGHFSEELEIEIGKLINSNPRLFLQELKNHRGLIVSLGGLVGNLGPDYVDELALRKKETEKRIRSLNLVTDKDLIATRDECLAELNWQAKIKQGD
jgi:hypothetical protein